MKAKDETQIQFTGLLLLVGCFYQLDSPIWAVLGLSAAHSAVPVVPAGGRDCCHHTFGWRTGHDRENTMSLAAPSFCSLQDWAPTSCDSGILEHPPWYMPASPFKAPWGCRFEMGCLWAMNSARRFFDSHVCQFIVTASGARWVNSCPVSEAGGRLGETWLQSNLNQMNQTLLKIY